MDAGIILQGRQPDIVNALDRANRARAFQDEAQNANAFRAMLQQNGPGIMRGDEGALNAFSRFDPNAALGVQQTRQGMAFDAERMQMVRDQAKREAAALLQDQDAAQKAAQLAQEANAFKGLAAAYATGNRQAFDQWVAQNGLDVTWETFPMASAAIDGVTEVLEQWTPKTAEPLTDVAKLQADLANGLITQDQFNMALAAKAPRGMSITTPDGFTFTEGVGVGAGVPAGQNPNVTGTPRDSGKLAQKLSEADSATIAAERDAAMSASTLESIANQMDVLAPQLGYTGPLGRSYGAVDDAIGVLPGDSGARGAFRSLSTEAQLTFTEKTKGAITDREMANFAAAVPSLGQTAEGNKTISEVIRAGAKRVQSRAQFMEAYASKVGSLEGAQAAWQKFMDANPVIVAGPDGKVRAAADGDWAAYLPGAGGATFKEMPLEELLRQDPTKMDIETLRQFNLRMDEVGL
ncbi:MAG: hypothetical protein ACRCSU_01640 [Paracoccaceae bacterium]